MPAKQRAPQPGALAVPLVRVLDKLEVEREIKMLERLAELQARCGVRSFYAVHSFEERLNDWALDDRIAKLERLAELESGRPWDVVRDVLLDDRIAKFEKVAGEQRRRAAQKPRNTVQREHLRAFVLRVAAERPSHSVTSEVLRRLNLYVDRAAARAAGTNEAPDYDAYQYFDLGGRMPSRSTIQRILRH